MDTHETFSESLQYSPDLKELIDASKEYSKNDEKKTNKSPQELTKLYDEVFERIFKDVDFGFKQTSIFSEATKNNFTYPESLYVCFTHYRRQNFQKEFIDLYNKVGQIGLNEGKSILADSLLESFALYYFIYKYEEAGKSKLDFDLITSYERIDEKHSNPLLLCKIKNEYIETDNLKTTTKVTYADFVYNILSANRCKYVGKTDEYLNAYKKALEAINEVLGASEENLKNYALYYSIRAKIMFLGLELGIEKEDCINDIRTNIETALKKENSSASGLRKRTQYLAQLSELNMFEMNLKIEKSEAKMKETEANSTKKFSAFSAFVTFAVGLISKFINSGATPFHETVGYFFVLFGISVAIFAFFDLLVLGPLSSMFKNEFNPSQPQRKISKQVFTQKFIIKLVIELGITALFIVLGCLIGFQALKVA